MKLLVIRCGDEYLRVGKSESGETQFEYCGLDKAHVFPLSLAEQLKDYTAMLTDEGRSPEIRQLTVTEEPYTE